MAAVILEGSNSTTRPSRFLISSNNGAPLLELSVYSEKHKETTWKKMAFVCHTWLPLPRGFGIGSGQPDGFEISQDVVVCQRKNPIYWVMLSEQGFDRSRCGRQARYREGVTQR
jgi:hypothetical protein